MAAKKHKGSSSQFSSQYSSVPLDGDPRWEQKLDAQLNRLRTRLQKKVNAAKGDRKASLVAQMREMREQFQKEHARLAESEKSGGYVVAKSTRKRRSKPATRVVVEKIGAALGTVVARLDAWKGAATARAGKANSSKMATRASARHVTAGARRNRRESEPPVGHGDE